MHELDPSETDLSTDHTSFLERLCYSCHTSLTSRSSRSRKVVGGQAVLPVWVADSLASSHEESMSTPSSHAVKKMGRAEMRQSIHEFLLE